MNFILKVTERIESDFGTLGYSATREEMVEKLAVLFESLDPSGSGNPKFIAHVVVSDLEEVYDLPFGTPRKIYPGFGGQRGLQLLQSDHKDNCTLERATEIYNAFILIDDYKLKYMGLFRDADKSIRVILNGRLLTINDCENLACKVSVSQINTTGSRRVSANPRPFRKFDLPSVHSPFVKKRDGTPAEDSLMIHKLFHELTQPINQNKLPDMHRDELKIPSQFLFPDEEEIWKNLCDNFDRDPKMYDQKTTTD
jgi:hypothetical protein